jgi:hypothetical protein
MKYLITEEQADTVKRIKVMERFIDQILSDYDWYEGIDKVSVEAFKFSRSNYYIPLYVFYIITNDDESAYRDATRYFNNRGDGVVEEVDDMFESLFPFNEPGIPSATWVFRFVRSENYGE